MPVKIDRAIEIQSSIRMILNEVWDPLDTYAFKPKDEYDSLIGPLYKCLRENPSVELIIEILSKFEISTGGEVSDKKLLTDVAARLMSLNVKL